MEAAGALADSARAGVAALAHASRRERANLSGLLSQLESGVEELARGQDTFMARQAIKVETQVVDRAMALLVELAQARRIALRSGEDARRALETAYLEAQKQYAHQIDDLNNQLIVAR